MNKEILRNIKQNEPWVLNTTLTDEQIYNMFKDTLKYKFMSLNMAFDNLKKEITKVFRL